MARPSFGWATGSTTNSPGPGRSAALVDDPSVTDIVVNGPGEVWVDRGGGMVRAGVTFPDAESLRRLAQRLAAACERRLDDGCPYVDARLPDGTRLHAVLPPVAVAGPYLSLRTFRQRPSPWTNSWRPGTLPGRRRSTSSTRSWRARLAYLVTGGTGSGKTTLLVDACWAWCRSTSGSWWWRTPPSCGRPTRTWSSLQSRPPNVEGAGAVTLRDLVRQALRMRPDRLVVGECRGAEVVDLLGALNTGHDGGAGTLHANRAADVPARLEALGLLGGMPRAALHAQVAAGLQVVLQVRPWPGGTPAGGDLPPASDGDRPAWCRPSPPGGTTAPPGPACLARHDALLAQRDGR